VGYCGNQVGGKGVKARVERKQEGGAVPLLPQGEGNERGQGKKNSSQPVLFEGKAERGAVDTVVSGMGRESWSPRRFSFGGG